MTPPGSSRHSNEEFHSSPFARDGVPKATAADSLQAFAHVGKAVAARGACGPGCGFPVRFDLAGIKPAPMIGNGQDKGLGLNFKGNADLGCLGMFEDIMERLLD